MAYFCLYTLTKLSSLVKDAASETITSLSEHISFQFCANDSLCDDSLYF